LRIFKPFCTLWKLMTQLYSKKAFYKLFFSDEYQISLFCQLLFAFIRFSKAIATCTDTHKINWMKSEMCKHNYNWPPSPSDTHKRKRDVGARARLLPLLLSSNMGNRQVSQEQKPDYDFHSSLIGWRSNEKKAHSAHFNDRASCVSPSATESRLSLSYLSLFLTDTNTHGDNEPIFEIASNAQLCAGYIYNTFLSTNPIDDRRPPTVVAQFHSLYLSQFEITQTHRCSGDGALILFLSQPCTYTVCCCCCCVTTTDELLKIFTPINRFLSNLVERCSCLSILIVPGYFFVLFWIKCFCPTN
jgi:hypothetical protein